MITISDGKLTIPEGQRFIGFTGDNRHTRKQFFIRNNTQSGWIYRLYLTFDDGTHNYFVLPANIGSNGTWLIWDIEESHIFKSGLVKAQIKAFSEGDEVYHTTSDVFVAGKSTEEDQEFSKENAEFLLYEKTLNDLHRKMQTASAKMPYVGTNGNWYTYDITAESYLDSGVCAYVPIADGGITPAMLDRSYWQMIERVPVTDYSDLDDILSNETAASAVFRLGFSGLSPLYKILGSGEFLSLTSRDCQQMLIVNILNGDRWLYEKESSSLQPVEVKEDNISDGAVTPLKLDRTYWEYQSASMTENANDILNCLSDSAQIQRFKAVEESSLYQQVGTHDLLGLKTSDNNCIVIDLQTFKRYRVEPMGNILVEFEPTYHAVTDAGTFYKVSELQSYGFKENTLYRFRLHKAIGFVGDCLGIYTEVDSDYDADTDTSIYYYGLRFINLLSGFCGELNLTTEKFSEFGGVTVDTDLKPDSDNPVSNSAVTEAIDNINDTLEGLEQLLSEI